VLVGFGGISSLSDDENDVPATTTACSRPAGSQDRAHRHLGLRVEGRILFPPSILNGVAKVGNESGFGGPDFEALEPSTGASASRLEDRRQKEIVRVAEPNPDPDGGRVVGAADKVRWWPRTRTASRTRTAARTTTTTRTASRRHRTSARNQAETITASTTRTAARRSTPTATDILGSARQCPDQPETSTLQGRRRLPRRNATGGQAFTGVIQGINFKTGSDKLLKGSFVISIAR